MTALPDPHRPGDDALYFLPLGGAGEIGMNLNLYGHAGKWLMVDLGITFADDTMPGLDVVLPDPAFIRDRREDLVGLVITHAHEDHLGAVQHLWPELRCPVYATPFTAAVLRAKLHEKGLVGQVEIREVPISGRFTLDPFEVELIRVTHSVPEPSALAIRTPAGTVLHTGDWKLDPAPILGLLTDEAALRRLGDEGVLAMICDSTNALVAGRSGSESGVRDALARLFGRCRNRIVVSCFATNVARIDSIARAAAVHDRHVALVGRSLWRICEAARSTGYLSDLPPFLSGHDVGYLPRDKVVLIATGGQGEPRSALARIAADDHPEIALEPGDTVVFSSREIPGNERAIGRVQNMLVRQGVELVTADTEPVHVSGHPARDELIRLYQWVRPLIAVPVHGEERQLQAHAQLARDCQVAQAVIPANGRILRLAEDGAEVVGEVPSGRLAIDGKRIVPLGRESLRGRHRIINNGAAVATLVIDRSGSLLGDPQLAVMGLLEDPAGDGDLSSSVVAAVRAAVESMSAADRSDDDSVRQAVRGAVRRSFNALQGKKPVTEVHLVRV